MTRRLFLFAGYDCANCIDDALTYTLGKLSDLGDIIFIMDCDCSDDELNKIRHLCLYASAHRHGEYDFGSYKRAYTYARDTNVLHNYDFVYMVNDSVYGPLYDLRPILENLESQNWDAFGIVRKPHKAHPHIQSWFIGCNKNVFMATWYDEFMTSITTQPSKGAITHIYEHGFSKKLNQHNHPWGAMWQCRGRDTYNKIKKLYISGMPFMKKLSVGRRHGALGKQISYVLQHANPVARNAILQNMRRIWGDKYICWLLTKNPVKIIIRNIHHSMYKIFIEGI